MIDIGTVVKIQHEADIAYDKAQEDAKEQNLAVRALSQGYYLGLRKALEIIGNDMGQEKT